MIAFSRKLDNEEVIVIINRGDTPTVFTHEALKTKKFKNAFTSKLVVNEINVKAMDIVVLSNQ